MLFPALCLRCAPAVLLVVSCRYNASPSSFFWYFCSIHNQSEMDPCTREAAELCRMSGLLTAENDYEIAHTLRTQLLASAVNCFTGAM
jgi:hypothetical protein